MNGQEAGKATVTVAGAGLTQTPAALMQVLSHNEAVLEECGEPEFHDIACRLAQCWDSSEIIVASRGAMVSGFVRVIT